MAIFNISGKNAIAKNRGVEYYSHKLLTVTIAMKYIPDVWLLKLFSFFFHT
jgi:hypothetical protein